MLKPALHHGHDGGFINQVRILIDAEHLYISFNAPMPVEPGSRPWPLPPRAHTKSYKYILRNAFPYSPSMSKGSQGPHVKSIPRHLLKSHLHYQM